MSLSISQIFAASYEAVEKKKAANQWSDNALLREMNKQGAIKRVAFGPAIEEQLDYRRNPGATTLASDLQPMTMTKTEVLTALSFAVGSLSVPVVWSKEDEAKNPTENQKVDLVDSLLNNAFESHDSLLEETFFTGANGIVGYDTMFSETGVNTIGGVDASSETWHKNKFDEWTDETDIEESMTIVWNSCTKGSGSGMSPTMAVSDATTQAIFEGTQQANQRWIDTDDLKAGFKTLGFKTARYIFTQNQPAARESIYFSSPKTLYAKVSSTHYRKKGATQEIDNGNGYRFFIYSAVQLCTNNRSRIGVAFS
jgi:hypothetical protein